MASALATGREIFGRDEGSPVKVMYVDYEMTEDDLHERLADLGYSADDEALLAENLRYHQLPSIPKLNTEAGAEVLLAAVDEFKPGAVVIDTASRAVEGDENSNDTWIDLYAHTLLHLKARGISILRLDHLGKDAKKGPRGGSAKGDDVDVEWKLTIDNMQTVVSLKTHGVSRLAWVPQVVNLTRKIEPLRHRWTGRHVHTQGEIDLINVLDELDIPVSWGRDKVRTELHDLGVDGKLPDPMPPVRNEPLSKAIAFRKQRPEKVEKGEAGQVVSESPQPLHPNGGTGERDSSGQVPQASGDSSLPLGGTAHSPHAENAKPL